MKNPDDYRPCVGIALLNKDNKVFVGRRIDTKVEAWQMPQGGIDPGEDIETALFREMCEEIGTDKAEIIQRLPQELYYDLPENIRHKLWNGRYVGQRQTWVLCQFLGQDSDINIHEPVGQVDPEFCEWKWLEIDQLPEVIVPFKRLLYCDVVRQIKRVLVDST